jgi:sugar-specific transcriptional regulator TrmB
MKQDIDATLQRVGLTKNETNVYLTALELGTTTTGPIIKRTGIHTSKVYDALNRLIDKGLVAQSISSTGKEYRAVDPDRIIEYLQRKKQQIDEDQQQVSAILPQLYALTATTHETAVEVFNGWEGMETVYRMMRQQLREGEENLVFGASKGEDEERTRGFFERHLQELAAKRIRQRIIYNESARGNVLEQQRHKKLFAIRHLQQTTPAEINIWSDNTMIVLLRKRPTVILIRDVSITASFRTYFDVMWRQAKP